MLLVIWASYGFRYSATPNPAASLNTKLQAALVIKARLIAENPALRPTAEQLAATPPGVVLRIILVLDDRHLLPQAWLNGLLYTYHTSLIRPAYLLGEISQTGWWYYFLLAMLFKTPLATLAATVAAGCVFAARRGPSSFNGAWATICLVVPAAIYFLAALRTNLNLGVRHVLPLYPFIFIASAIIFARAWQASRRLTSVVAAILLLLLALESLTTWPNYIAFFNYPAGGSRGGIRLLGDSNLDWGQDLPLLGKWQKEHPDRPIQLIYFGSAEPSIYLDAERIDPTKARLPPSPAVLAVSATYLQGLYIPEAHRSFYQSLRRREPTAVLGGTIYIFEPSPGNLSPP
jgi:hypothetical protein